MSLLCCRPTGPKLPKMPQLQDFQFYQQDRLKEMYEKEAAFELHQHSLAQKEAAARAQGASEEVVKSEVSSLPDVSDSVLLMSTQPFVPGPEIPCQPVTA